MTGGPPPGYTEETLREMPSLRRLYARAVGRTRTLVMSRPVLAPGGLPPVVLRVDGVRADARTLSEYQHLLGEPGTDRLPTGYVHVLAFPLAMAVMVRPDFPLQVLGMVHVANRVEQHRTLELGETFSVRAWAQNARRHRKGAQVDLVVEVRAAGEDLPVWRGVSTYLSTGRVPSGLELGPEVPREERPAPPAAPTAVWRLGVDTGRRYAEVSGDRNPIHLSRLGARMFGFRRPIAHGMYTAARALAAVRAPERFEWAVELGKPVLLPSTVAFAASGEEHTVWSPKSGKVHLTGTVRPLR